MTYSRLMCNKNKTLLIEDISGGGGGGGNRGRWEHDLKRRGGSQSADGISLGLCSETQNYFAKGNTSLLATLSSPPW